MKLSYAYDSDVVILRYKQPFVDWLNQDRWGGHYTLESMHIKGEPCLIPADFVDDEESIQWVKDHWNIIFDHILNQWNTNPKEWPQDRTLDMFNDWFTIELYTTPVDLHKL